MDEKPEAEKMKFEQALRKLEEIAGRISSGKEDLDTMLVLYEEGIAYLKVCRERLEEAQQKVKVLNERLKKEIPEGTENG
ncbi:MAG TPA: exodeoxyribonuclease VII small subunit [Candidatus Cloacimonadota bacterium]|nr:exodeoxyribonuclease VII small subunit [Candidatus Cloacimonadota bacterium]HOV16128.1 exodeoxyribonuclease VII small subunit [Candidatus Cloacimonadota bacterium]HQL14776.1 exodeoxyribonuclease VII small subunit [Candidatus Cloacimonadota bacterium]